MRVLILLAFALALGEARASDVADACLADLDVLPAFLLANDAGARDSIARHGQAAFDAAFANARRLAGEATGEGACVDALRSYLRAYRHGHLGIAAVPGAGEHGAASAATTSDPKAPSFRVLSTQTALITLPSFGDHYAPLIAALVAKHRREIAARPYLIVDVRRNNGGSDAAYAPLLPLFDANITRTIGAEFLATPDNVAASEAVCKLPSVVAQSCAKFMAPVIEAMKSAPAGTYVLPRTERRLAVETPRRALDKPERIAVLIDRPCGSSCEEFVLAVRQSFKVKTFGRPTYGALDYSNLRPHELPSRKRRLFYATSRSLRLPSFPVDAAGIAPDQFLPLPEGEAAFEAEVETAREVLELRPRSSAGSTAGAGSARTRRQRSSARAVRSRSDARTPGSPAPSRDRSRRP